jgi:hypothetical protein
MIRKNFKKDFQSFLEVLASSRSEEPLKLKSERLRTESRMLFAQLKLQLRKVL